MFETRPPPPPEQVFVLLCQSVIVINKYLNANFPLLIIVNCFHVFVNDIPTLRAYIHWAPAFEAASNVCLFTNNMKFEIPHTLINLVMVYVHIMLIFHGNIHGSN